MPDKFLRQISEVNLLDTYLKKYLKAIPTEVNVKQKENNNKTKNTELFHEKLVNPLTTIGSLVTHKL